jgi:hypothetical protein
LDEKFEVISPQWKKYIKKEIEPKKEYNAKFDISFSDEDIMDICGHEKKLEE